ncbi:MAG: flagellar M-ring protein FliF C-terminal domain-containing protein [Planctomycetota bacterium]
MKFSDRMSQSYQKVEGPVKEFLGKLSSSQRWSLGILGVVVLLMLAMVVAYGPTDNRTIQVPLDEDGLLVQDLDTNSIPYVIEGDHVVLAARYRSRVQRLFIENPAYNEDPNLFGWLYDQPSWNESSAQRREKLTDSKRREVVAAIQDLEGVKKAVVTVNLVNNSRFVLGEKQSTASVNVHTEASRLNNKLARGIRGFVAGSFGIQEQNVTITDGNGNVVARDDSVDFLDEEKAATEEKLRRKIVEQLGTSFAADEFMVAVDIKQDRKTVRSQKTDFDPAGLVTGTTRERSENDESISRQGAPGTKPNAASMVDGSGGVSTTTTRSYEETEFENYASREDSTIQAPAGEIELVKIMVRVSRHAIAGQIKALKPEDDDAEPTEEEILSRAKEIEEDVRSVPAVEAEKIHARVRPVVMRASMTTVADEQAAGMLGYAQNHVREIVLGMMAIVGCFLLYRAASRGTPELEPLPDPVADLQHFLRDKEDRDRQRAIELEQERKEKKQEVDWEAREEDREAIDLLESVSQFAEERPDIVAAVLRNWLHEKQGEAEPTPNPEEEA